MAVRAMRGFGVLLVVPFIQAAQAETPQADTSHVRPVVSEIIMVQSALTKTWVGTIAAPTELELAFPRTGTVVERTAGAGDRVATGQVLARQNPEELNAAVRSAEAGVAIAEAQLATARDTAERVATLVRRGVESEATQESAISALAATEAQLEQALASVVQARDARSYADLTAPRDGVVVKVYAEPGATLSAGEALFLLATTDEREVVVDLGEVDVSAFSVGTVFEVRLQSNAGTSATAELTSVDAEASPATRTRRAHLTLDKTAPDSFRLGALAIVAPSESSQGYITLPADAVIAGTEPPQVWVVAPADRKVRRVTIEGEVAAGGRIVVTSGLAIGDEVVVKGVNSIEDGQVVGVSVSR